MTFGTLILRSLQFRFRAHLGVVLGAMVGSAALVGALVVGDSVRETLRQKALDRVGAAQFVLAPADRFFSDSSNTWAGAFGPSCPVALHLPAVASAQAGAARANAVQAYGVTPEFWQFAPKSTQISIEPNSVLLNQALAAQLGAQPGDEVLLRVRKPSPLSRETPLAPVSDLSVALRLKVQAILAPEQFGNFGRVASQAPPFNAFLRLDELQHATGLAHRANLVLLIAYGHTAQQVAGSLTRDLQQHWSLADAELELSVLEPARPGRLALPAQEVGRAVPGEPFGLHVELRSSRIFLEPAVVRVATNLAPINPSIHQSINPRVAAQPLLTYLVNQFRAGTNATPYSMVTAAGPPWTPADLREDEIIIDQWLAEDLKLDPGGVLELAYFLPESAARLAEATNRFRVRSVAPLAGLYADRTLMPEFPGIAKAESTHDWDAGFPLVHEIRPKDEAYWKQYRGTPKAFVSLAAGEKLWANRFGSLTAIRFPAPAGADPGAFRAELERALLGALRPTDLGLRFEPVRAQALSAAGQAQDFGQLFLGFSFFLIAAALILMALLFQLGLEQRAAEVGTLLAIGFTPRQVRRLFWAEGTALGLAGGVLGAGAGLGYARLLLKGLTTLWREAVSGAGLQFHASAGTLAAGLAAGAVVSSLTIGLVLRRQARRPARELLAQGAETNQSLTASRRGGAGFSVGSAALAGALGLLGWVLARGDTQAAGAFFGAGALLLAAGLGLTAGWLGTLAGSGAAARLSLFGLGLRGATRRRKRSLAVAGLLACGSFLVVAIGAFKLDARQNAWRRDSGTGGFALIGQSALPVVRDLNTPEGRGFYALDEGAFAGVSMVPLRVHEGDEASCLNLNRAQQPRLLGVNPNLLADRGAFTFVSVAKGLSIRDGWRLLESRGQPDIPAVGDENSILWAMGKKVGERVEMVDERGRAFSLRLVGAVANSILQGNLLIDEGAFKARFPGESGCRMLLVDAPTNAVGKVSAALTRALQDAGLELTPAAQRLAAFNAVQNTYLDTFQVLGALGLLLGSAGLGVVVLRNVLERRSELALLQAVGFRRRTLQGLVLSEHAALLWIGLGIGTFAALIAILPAWRAPGSGLPLARLGLTLLGILASGLVWTWLATWVALRGSLLEGLREE